MDITKNNFLYYKESSSFTLAYNYWVNNLFERICRLFEWTNTGDDLEGGIDPIHIEKPLLLFGNVGIAKYENELTAFAGSYSGVSKYYDRYPYFLVRSPQYSGLYTIGKDIAIIRNNANETNMQHICHRYAIMLAHTEVTLVTLLVNARVSSVPTVNNNKQKAIVDDWRSGVYNGKINTIVDSGFLSVKWQDVNLNSGVNIKDLMEVRENLLCSFYHDVGVRTTQTKKGNLIQAELQGNDAMLLLNIDDMLDARKRGCEFVNKLFGTNWSVKKCKELEYNDNIDVNAVESPKQAQNENV